MPWYSALRERLLKFALAYPGAHEDHPWGETVVKVKGKVFVFAGMKAGDTFGISVKLPESGGAATMLPFASPTGYGLGKSGWVSAKFAGKQAVPEGLLLEWIAESYRAVAPKKLLKELDSAATATERERGEPGRRRPATKKAPPRPAKMKASVKARTATRR